MVPAPALAAVGEDVLWCLGLGLLAAALRDAAGLLLGNGRVLSFVWDLLFFAFAAVLLTGFSAGVSATGVVRWYMAAAMLAGAMGWSWALSGPVHALARRVLRLLLLPLQAWERFIWEPLSEKARTAVESSVALHQKRKKKHEKKPKPGKKQLQKQRRVLYN